MMFSSKTATYAMIVATYVSPVTFASAQSLRRRGAAAPHRELDGHGCLASAGYQYCNSLETCVRPWEEDCPVQNGQGFVGEMTLECSDGQCSDVSCSMYDISNKFSLQGPWIPELNGDYLLPASCTATCENCQIKTFPVPETDGHGCIASAGYSYCEETDKCIRFDENCPISNGTQVSGSKELTCSSGARLSDLTSECNLIQVQDDGSDLYLSGPYIGNLDGTYLIPEGCSATVVGCTYNNLMG